METITFGFAESPLGTILVARNSQGVCDLQFLGFDRHRVIHELGARWGVYTPTSQSDGMARQVERLIFASPAPFASSPLWEEIPLCPKGTEFQQQVWRELRRIPYATTVSYQQVADRLGLPTEVDAVTAAIDGNPIAILIPSHRVTRGDGTPGGYHWGAHLQRQLIDWEARHGKP